MKRHLASSLRPAYFESLEARKLLSLSVQLVEVPISQAAKSADPTLNNFRTYDVQVKLDSGERWLSMDLHAKLTKGSFYNTPKQGENFAQKNLWTLLPALEADTAVSASNFSRPIILGQYSPAKANGGLFTSNEVNVSFGALQDNGTGTQTVARLTMSKDATGTIVGQTSSTLTNASQPKQFQFNLTGGSNVVLSHISGKVFDDTSANGKQDSGEKGIPNWKIYLDKNNNGKFDSGEKYRLTDANGGYSFDSLTPGTYYVRQVTPTGWRRTAPSKTNYVVTLSSGVNGTGKNWGNTQRARISGTLFEDKNKNGKLDSNEKKLSGWNVYIDANNNGKLDSGEKIAGTDSNGYWVFKSLKAGTYVIRLQGKQGFKMSSATSVTVKAAAGSEYTGRLFSVYRI